MSVLLFLGAVAAVLAWWALATLRDDATARKLLRLALREMEDPEEVWYDALRGSWDSAMLEWFYRDLASACAAEGMLPPSKERCKELAWQAVQCGRCSLKRQALR